MCPAKQSMHALQSQFGPSSHSFCNWWNLVAIISNSDMWCWVQESKPRPRGERLKWWLYFLYFKLFKHNLYSTINTNLWRNNKVCRIPNKGSSKKIKTWQVGYGHTLELCGDRAIWSLKFLITFLVNYDISIVKKSEYILKLEELKAGNWR